MDNPWKIISSKIAYQNPWMKVREDQVIRPDGKPGMYGVIETKDSVMVGALNDKNELYMIHTFSYPAQKWHWELPAGGDDDEDSVTASKRELFEETGIRATTWVELPTTRPFDGLIWLQQPPIALPVLFAGMYIASVILRHFEGYEL